MSNYVKIEDYAIKDGYITGNPLKLIKGTELNSEFNAIQTAIGTKADLASPAFTGNPTAFTQTFGNSSDRLATTNFVQSALAALYPVGSIYTSTIATNPNTLFGFGTWVAFGAGRVLIGQTGTAPYVAGTTGGSADAIVVTHTHTATVTDPGHSHTLKGTGYSETAGATPVPRTAGELTIENVVNSVVNITGITVANSTTGSSGTNANLQPYVVVYMWNRTA